MPDGRQLLAASRSTVWRRQAIGTASVEFLLLMPLFIGIILVLLQLAFLMQAKIVVNQAALVAARSIIANLPTTLVDRANDKTEGPAEIAGDDPSSPKVKLTRRAAALVLATVTARCSALDAVLGDPSMINAKTALAAAAAMFIAGGARRDLAEDLARRYACANTPERTAVEIRVERLKEADKNGAQPAMVHLSVTYNYLLVVPVANRMLANKRSRNLFGNGQFYREIKAEYSLPVDLSPLMPEKVQPGMYFEPEELE